jgi:branched-chain amino acid transport system permease protein
MILAGLLYLFINKTLIGKAIQATSMDKDAAALVGIDVEKSYALAFAISAAVTGAAGSILTYYYYIFPGVGATFLLFGFIAVAIGGFGSIVGALAGGIMMGIMDMSIGVAFNTAFKYLAVCVLYIVIVSVRPKGLFGK